ncbi:hypothetical protein SAMD00019534_116580 [Acytostelium subglobosum LB1]|uniref:hypothetical protein n=1 Tax=Acytostelium subglobosum LB1 TaxID=1410327 RepID=UPI000644C2D8|nr:hypothetical protein SAMD00019534_116580 [Acytostelium subglobosum LB1]GAM28482.1 hypothetical protein SAMD00019534_116580 [Acytostelium subglobosum LB1]|eukprot:XP_012748521.1 hypothetical protein SAMD00019534_116580 [Acytostelium subglobosum LB1]
MLMASLVLTMTVVNAGNLPKSFYDFIVVGSGPAGSIVSYRLAEEGYSVLVLEAGKQSMGKLGGEDIVGTKGVMSPTGEYLAKERVTIYDVPSKWQAASISGAKWGYKGTGIAQIVGGCTNHNGMVFQPGTCADYNSWGVPGWNCSVITNAIKKLSTIQTPALVNSTIHGHSGPIKINSLPFDREGMDFIASCNASGLPFNDDFQKEPRDGCGYFNFNVDKNTGLRSSPAHEYLIKAINDYSTDLVAEATVQRIKWRFDLFSNKYMATGVEYVLKSNPSRVYTVNARKEVILAAGALNTPKILMQSGVGNETYLNQFKPHIPNVVSDLPGVGRNLKNHFLFFGLFKYDGPETRPSLYEQFSLDIQYQTTGAGFHGTPGYSTGVWLRSNRSDPLSVENVMIVQPGAIGSITPFKSVMLGVSISKPKPGVHFIALSTNKSGDCYEFFARHPEVNFTLFQNPEDANTLLRGWKEANRIMSFPPMSSLMTNIVPGNANNDTEMLAYIKSSAVPHDHWCCTAKMGPATDPMAVVDPQLRVIGVKSLRVVDASVIVDLPHSLMQATVMAVAEVAAGHIIAAWS